MVVGGMYNVLEKIREHLELAKKQTFTTTEIVELTGLCRKSVTNNLTRLIEIGFIKSQKIEKHKKGRFVVYSINTEVIDFIKEVLY
jgi:predicted transcriptional regulator